MDFITSGYVLAGFMTIYGALFFWLGTRETLRDGKQVLIKTRILLMLLGGLYLGLAFLNVYVATGNSLFLTNMAPCENIISSTTELAGLTTYTYVDSCANRGLPSTNERLYIILGYTMMLNFVAVVVGLGVAIFRVIFSW